MRAEAVRAASSVLLALCGAAPALASSTFVELVPNGAAHSCLTCHLQDDGGEGWNDFGQEILETGGANPDANPDDQNDGFVGPPRWGDVCELDSDGDGYRNGEELGDPTCTWAAGDDDPEATPTNPGDAQDFPADDLGGLCTSSLVASDAPLGALAVVVVAAGLLRRRVSSRRS
ncbi:MAG: hypothetical protein HYS27_16060 [Deltaproteobacteria bacterium]|nr:hypothetical protein [Deltaproteobacteria bacterium]